MESIIELLRKAYNGPVWYGKSVRKTLEEVPIGKALLRLNGSYNIAELVYHMMAWRRYVAHLLKEGKSIVIEENENFPTIEYMTVEDWHELVDRLDQSQKTLEKLMQSSTMNLSDPVPSKPYTLADVLHGIIQHDVYHIGQINFLAKFL